MCQIGMELRMNDFLSSLDKDVFIGKYANGENWVSVR